MPDETQQHATERQTPQSLELLMSSVYYLMTRYARRPAPCVAHAIVEHLRMIAGHPDCNSELMRNAGRRLAMQWSEHILPTLAAPCALGALHAGRPGKLH